MASVYGTSKSWGEIQTKLGEFHLSADKPSDIEPLLERCQIDYEQQIKQVRQKIKSEIAQLKQEIIQEEETTRANLAILTSNTSLQIEQAKSRLEHLKQDRGFSNSVRNLFRIPRESLTLARLQKTLKEQLNNIERPLHSKEMDLERKKSQVDELARAECGDVLAQIEFLRNLLISRELAGAVAELELQENLRQLPDNVHLINNMMMAVERGILFEGKWLVKGQIDQLVLTPSGLFAIDVINWSKQPEKKGSAPDPFEEIRRAAQLCYEMIKPIQPGINVRSILAYRGRPPEEETSGAVKSLPLHEVASYIGWFKDKSVSSQVMQQLLTRLDEIKTNVEHGQVF
jgi:Nuclease-related domain